MHVFRQLVVCVFLALASGLPCAGAQSLARSILIVSPSDARGPFYYRIFDTLRAVVNAVPGPPVTLYLEHLDLNRFGGPDYEASLQGHLRVKYREKPVGVLVAVGPAALTHVLRWRDDLWPGVPIVFVMVDEVTAAPFKGVPGLTGSVIRVRYSDMLMAARAVVPGLERVALVGDPLRSQPLFRPLADQIAASEDPVKLIDLTGIPMRRLREQVASLPDRTAILYTAIYSDGEGTYFPPADAVATLAGVANRPIIVSYETFLGSGAAGGFLLLPSSLGETAAGLALRLLAGEPLTRMPVTVADSARPMFDWRALQRWGVDPSRLPEGSEIRYRDPSVWERYRWQISTAMALILLQAVMISGLLYERRRRLAAEGETRLRTSELAHMNRHATAGELSASIAHELNQPLGAILNNAEAAIAMLGAPSPDLAEIRAILHDIKRDDDRASQIIGRLRRLLKRTELETQDVELNEIVREVFQLIGAESAARGVTLVARLSPEPLHVLADRIQLQQVVLNLVVNAIEALADANVATHEVIGRTARLPDGTAAIAIADTGPGIADDAQKRLFEPFYTTKKQGMGMGLSIARTIVEAHGGRIDARRGAAGGAEFEVVLPLGKAH